jgi:two-component system sensor kinase FixL
MNENDCILVVDDEEGQRKSLTLLLKRKGFKTEQAGSGKEALAIAQDTHIDVTLLDIRLPDIDGIRLLAPLKKTNPDMVIIMITGFASVESAVQSLTAGASSYITKPINLEELFLKIKTALDHQHLVDNVRRAEEELKVSLAKYKVLFESFPIAITISDRKGNIVESNRRAEEILGLSAEEQARRKIGGTDWHLIRPDGTPMPAEEYASVRALKENHLVDNVEMGIVKGTGPVTWINVTAAPIPVKDYGVAIAYSDITERKKAEEQREALIRELEQKNAELARFTYTVSHELRTPLITIQGFAGLLDEDISQGRDITDLKNHSRRITAAVDTLETLLSDILKLSRAGKSITLREPVDFGTIVREAGDLFTKQIDEHKIHLDIIAEFPEVNADHVRIREVLINLIENAIKFLSDQKDPVIRIGVDTKGLTPVFFVQDNGMGIDPRYLERIFNLFEKMDGNTQGTGVGLAITKRIIEVHGGRIWAESEGPGKGTTFRFTLPAPACEDH